MMNGTFFSAPNIQLPDFGMDKGIPNKGNNICWIIAKVARC